MKTTLSQQSFSKGLTKILLGIPLDPISESSLSALSKKLKIGSIGMPSKILRNKIVATE